MLFRSCRARRPLPSSRLLPQARRQRKARKRLWQRHRRSHHRRSLSRQNRSPKEARLPETLVLGVDIGGTKVAAGLVDARGQIVQKVRRPMAAQGTAEGALAAVLRAVNATLQSDAARAAAVRDAGVSLPGYVDRKSTRLNSSHIQKSRMPSSA